MLLTRLLRRKTTGGSYLPEIDSLRFLAISMTIGFHFIQKIDVALLSDDKMIAGKLGSVPIFFVLSGFILARPFASYWLKGGKKVSLTRYFRRRLTRIEPPYIVALLLCVALLVPVKHQKFAALTPHLSASLLYVHNIVYQRLSSINPVTWSLEVEIQFYMLVPPLTLLFAIRSTLRRRTLFILLIVICGMAAYLGRHHFLINHSILGSVQNFLAGFLLADVYLLNPCKFRSIGWDVAAVTTLPLMMLTPPFLWKVVLPLGLVLLFWTAFYGRFTNRIFRIEVFSLLGGMCYSYYLLHQQIISIVFSFVHQPVPVQVLVALMLIFIFCTLYYLAVEKPCMDPQWPELLWAKMRRIIAGRSRECGAVIDRDDVSVA